MKNKQTDPRCQTCLIHDILRKLIDLNKATLRMQMQNYDLKGVTPGNAPHLFELNHQQN